MTYLEKLRDPRWQKKRLEILNRDDFRCTVCGDTETELHIHHEEYSGDPWDASTDKLRSLCKYCHKVAEFHKKDYANCIISIKSISNLGDIVINSVFTDTQNKFFITVDLIINDDIVSVITIKENTLNQIINLLDCAKKLAKIL